MFRIPSMRAQRRPWFSLASAKDRSIVSFRHLGEGAAQTGLSLNVLDFYTGKARSVKTLSGGETFMASLSLALGMADVIARSSGGIQLETMFIDEGFGSLDSDSLDLALRILSDLSGGQQLVGIISHVSELAARIDRKLLVKKSTAGSRIVEE